MALDASSLVKTKRILLYPEKSPSVSTYWRDEYEKDALKYWNVFYKRNGNRFFKDRHYLNKEWGQYFHETVGVSGRGQTILEVGCGTGNTVYPLLSKFPQSFVYACDFSSKAVELLCEGRWNPSLLFSEDDRSFFVEEGFECKEIQVHCFQLVMDRRWIQAAFFFPSDLLASVVPCLQPSVQSPVSPSLCNTLMTNSMALNTCMEALVMDDKSNLNRERELMVDLSVGCTAELFGGSPPLELFEIPVGKYSLQAKCLPKENQHTFGATGFILWDSAAAFGELLALNPSVTHDKTVLELGCGSVGLCCLMTSLCAKNVVATVGDADATDLLQDNLRLNKVQFAPDKTSCHKLEWGNEQDVDAVKAAGGVSGF